MTSAVFCYSTNTTNENSTLTAVALQSNNLIRALVTVFSRFSKLSHYITNYKFSIRTHDGIKVTEVYLCFN